MQNVDSKRTLLDELPSICLLTFSYMAFISLTVYASDLGIWLAILLLIPVLVLHSSLQHEFIHGHPTSSQTFNDFLVSAPLSLFVPYIRFKDTHLAHHYDPNLTDPYDDPESNFFDPKLWNTPPKWKQALCNFNNTLFGRMCVGPLIGLMSFYRDDLFALLKLNSRILLSYIHHGIGLVLLLLWFFEYATLPLWALVVASYLSMSVLKIRTFLEHMAHERVAARTVLIEDRGPLALLFLNNNYHAIHHSYPKLAWHKLRSKFYERKDDYLKRNGGYWFQSYWSVFRLYFFSRKDPVPHPLMDGFKSEQPSGPDTKGTIDAVEVRNS